VTIFHCSVGGAGYDVLIGPLAEAGGRLTSLAAARVLPLVTDARIFVLHGEKVRAILPIEPIFVPEGEATKTWDILSDLIGHLSRLNVGRDTPILALGGGSIGDVAGLAASLFKRGCPIVHIPTTMLAQADSAIGGKTAIDWHDQKNLIGTFHQPSLVIADPAFLQTLDARQLRAGYAEVVKYGMIDDPAFFEWCEANGAALLAGNEDLRKNAIEHCIRAKLRFVADDVDDRSGVRALLNLGHSFGHAIETVSGLGNLLHGEAVAIGLCLAFGFSVELGLCPSEDEARVKAHLASVGLPTRLDEVGLAASGPALLDAMKRDKKATSEGISLILLHGIGRAELFRGIDPVRLANFLDQAS
jgi:3-dehydroquinate synthase